jgi:DNA-binding response OmpR family regulator
MGQLRRKVDTPDAPALIQTVRGSGYRLRAPA